MIFRKSDVRRRGRTRSWEMLLSHDLRIDITSGFCKCTASSDIIEAMKLLRACTSDLGHPLSCPCSCSRAVPGTGLRKSKRQMRDCLRRLEGAISMRRRFDDTAENKIEGHPDLAVLKRDLLECQAQVM